MKRLYCITFALFAAVTTMRSQAALVSGEPAPNFDATATQGGAVSAFKLSQALQKGPVVLYFFPAAFTQGCTVEAHDFTEAIPSYQALGATVIGVSADDIETLKRFSVSECQSKFAVAADPDGKIIRSYDVASAMRPGSAQRVSYVIAPDGKLLYAYSDSRPDHHVSKTLEALRAWAAKKRSTP